MTYRDDPCNVRSLNYGDMSVGVFRRTEGKRIGTVVKFMGEPKSRRWAAYSVYRLPGDKENSAQFPTRKAAIVWLNVQDAEHAKV